MRQLRRLTRFAKRHAFWRDQAGVAAVEFAFLVPVLMLMTFGTIELTRALIIHKRFQRSAAMVGDLVAREKQLWPETKDSSTATTADAKATLAGIMIAAQHAMEPYSTKSLTIKVYQVWANMTKPTQTKIEWSYEYNFDTTAATTTGCGDSKTVDSGVLVGNGRAIFVEAKYNFKTILKNLLPGTIGDSSWSDTMVATPRDVPSVLYLPALNNNSTWDKPSLLACQ